MNKIYVRYLLLLAVILAVGTGCKPKRPPPGTNTGSTGKKPPATQTTAPVTTSTSNMTAKIVDGIGGRRTDTWNPQPAASRYKAGSPFWSILTQVKPDRGQMVDVWFSWSPSERVLESTIATAASVPWKRSVGYMTVHKEFCESKPRSCEIADVVAIRQAARIKLTAIAASIREVSRDSAIRACESQLPELLNKIAAARVSGNGVMVVGYIQGAFSDSGKSDIRSDVHPFTVESVHSTKGLFLLDSAESEPFLYQLKQRDICKFLAAPEAAELQFGQRPPATVSKWGVNIWSVSGTPPDPPPTGIADLGAFLLPRAERVHWTYLFGPLGNLPDPKYAKLKIGVNQDEAAKMADWMDQIEIRCRMRQRPWYAGCASERWSLLYNGAAENSDWAVALSKIFRTRARDTARPQEWEIEAIIRFVQVIRYEIPYERPHGVRPPEQILASLSGDCDSKSVLGAVLLHRLDYHVGILASSRHAVMAIASQHMPWVRGGFRFQYKGRQFIPVEMTAEWPAGQMSESFWEDADEFYPVGEKK
ncbi:MAG: hypothetical protein FWD57_10335 [Polyangiaceae bacterium]|nr:hypothetical protein [Polyangiaceae bacterium]